MAERLRPAGSSVRLTLLEALSTAADEITRELAPGSVELRLRSGEPEFVVARAAEPAEGRPNRHPARGRGRRDRPHQPPPARAAEDGIEQAAARERLSVNSWLVRALGAAVVLEDRPPHPRAGRVGDSYKGWVR